MHSFVHQYDEELDALKKERRPGRPASTREDLLRIKIAADEKEYENGFCQFYNDLILLKH
jgi:translation machinery-associated protein 16